MLTSSAEELPGVCCSAGSGIYFSIAKGLVTWSAILAFYSRICEEMDCDD